MKRKLILFGVAALLGLALWANGRKEIAILSVNDMHAAIEHFPKLAALADSLRGEYPALLLLSAGDNRTGNPLSDAYKEPSYPMTALMNLVGFHASAIGNHEFDDRVEGFVRQARRSAFRYLCANVEPADSIHVVPYQVFDVEGIRVGILGLTQLGIHGIPDTHPLNVEGLRFASAEKAIERYGEELRSRSDITILLSHGGYEHDVALAERFPEFDVIIGGHTHTRIEGTERHNGVLITQTEDKLRHATLIRLVVEAGKVVGKEAKLLPVAGATSADALVGEIVRQFSQDERLEQVLTQAEAPFNNVEELGCLMTDALRMELDADVALQNYGCPRYGQLPAGPITIGDVLRLDPFANQAIELSLTGQELADMILACRQADRDRPPYVAGIRYEIVVDKQDQRTVRGIRLMNEDGTPLDMNRRYKVATSHYVATISDSKRQDQGRGLRENCTDLLIDYLSKQSSVNYSGIRRATVIFR